MITEIKRECRFEINNSKYIPGKKMYYVIVITKVAKFIKLM